MAVTGQMKEKEKEEKEIEKEIEKEKGKENLKQQQSRLICSRTHSLAMGTKGLNVNDVNGMKCLEIGMTCAEREECELWGRKSGSGVE